MTDIRDEPQDLPAQTTREEVFRGYVWDVVSETFPYNGDTLKRDFVRHPGAAAVVALDADERVLLIQQYRHPIRTRDWELPAGLLDVVGEDPQDAAARELAEEADLAASRWDHLVSTFTTPGGNDEIIHIYLARDLRAVTTHFVREGEEADMRREWVTLSDATDAIMAGHVRNGVLIAGVLATAERLRREA